MGCRDCVFEGETMSGIRSAAVGGVCLVARRRLPRPRAKQKAACDGCIHVADVVSGWGSALSQSSHYAGIIPDGFAMWWCQVSRWMQYPNPGNEDCLRRCFCSHWPSPDPGLVCTNQTGVCLQGWLRVSLKPGVGSVSTLHP